MRRLSSVVKPGLDHWITLAFVVMAVLAVVAAWQGGHHGNAVPWVTMACSAVPVIAALSARGRRMLASGVVDEAWIDDGELLLKRAGQSIRMPLANIASVEAGRDGSLVTLELGLPCALGNRIRFFAPARRARDASDELRQRVARVRRQA